MRCPDCDTELPDEARYCWQCGRGRAPDVEPGPEPRQQETCEILFDVDWGVLITCRFWARAVGREGEYNAGESEPWVARYPDASSGQAVTARAVLLRRLLNDGWQHTGRGFFWFNDRLCRPLT